MSDPLSDAALDAVRARLAAEPPWADPADVVARRLADLIADGWDERPARLFAHAPADLAALLAEVDRLRAQAAADEAEIHDHLQDRGGASCRRSRAQGRKEGLLEAAAMLEADAERSRLAAGAAAGLPDLAAAYLDEAAGQAGSAARLRALAGQVDAGTGVG